MKWIGLIILLSTVSCSEIESDLPTTARPVVQAYLMPGHVPKLNVKRETFFLDAETSIDITNLEVFVETSGQKYAMSPLGTGNYSNTDLVIEEGGTYQLLISYNGTQVSAVTDIPSKPTEFKQSGTEMAVPTFSQGFQNGFPDPIELTWSNSDGSYYLVVVEVADENPTRINPNNTGRPPFAFRNDPTQGSRQLLMAQQFQYYSRYRVILFKVTHDYAALYQQNGTSSINIKTPATNVTNGLGIFTGMNADTVFVQIKKPG